MGDNRGEWVVEGLRGLLLQIDGAQIVVHEGDEPNAVIDLFEPEFLTGEHG
jgi:hypothetical protein